MPQAWPSKGSGNSEVLKLKAGETKVVHIVVDMPWETRTAFHSVLQKAVTLPPAHDKIEGENTRYGFVVYDYDDKQVKPMFAGITKTEEIRTNKAAWDARKALFDIEIKREGSGFEDTKYTYAFVPSQFSEKLIEGAEFPDMEALTKPSSKEDIQKHINTPDPQLIKRRAEREAKDSTAKQRKYLEDCIDKAEVDRSDFAKMLATVDADEAEAGAWLPKKLTVGQAGKLIDMVKEF